MDPRVRNELSVKDNKALKYQLASVSVHVRKKLLNLVTQPMQFTEQQI